MNRPSLLLTTLVLALFLCTGLAWANPMITDRGLTYDNFLINNSGFFIDGNTKFTKTHTSVGYGNATDYDLYKYASRSSAQAQIDIISYFNSTGKRGQILLTDGDHNMTAAVFMSRSFLNASVVGISVMGTSWNTNLNKERATASAMYNLGTPTTTDGIARGIRFSNLHVVGGNNNTYSGGLVTGKPTNSDFWHRDIMVDNILGENSSGRLVDLNAHGLIVTNNFAHQTASLYGGTATEILILGNIADSNFTSNEVECVDLNSINGNNYVVGDNICNGFGEQEIDISHRWGSVHDNILIIQPGANHQAGISVGRLAVVHGNVIRNNSGATSYGIQAVSGGDRIIFANNLISNQNLSDTSTNCMALSGTTNHTIIGNYFHNCTVPFDTTGTGNELWVNKFEGNSTVSESFPGINIINQQIRHSGLPSNFTRNATFEASVVLEQSNKICLDGSACTKFIQANATGLILKAS